jgi:uncharacterized damage-inducible protein DinB
MHDPSYPIGKFDPSIRLDEPGRRQAMDDLAATPARLRAAVLGLDDQQLDTPYREGGWTVRQVVHHVPDSHLNGYLRFKLGLTEGSPEIKLYQQSLWAELPEARTAPIAVSLVLLEALHERWDRALRAMSAADFERTVTHPERGPVPLDNLLALYAWHGQHHVGHINSLRERMGWA